MSQVGSKDARQPTGSAGAMLLLLLDAVLAVGAAGWRLTASSCSCWARACARFNSTVNVATCSASCASFPSFFSVPVLLLCCCCCCCFCFSKAACNAATCCRSCAVSWSGTALTGGNDDMSTVVRLARRWRIAAGDVADGCRGAAAKSVMRAVIWFKCNASFNALSSSRAVCIARCCSDVMLKPPREKRNASVRALPSPPASAGSYGRSSPPPFWCCNAMYDEKNANSPRTSVSTYTNAFVRRMVTSGAASCCGKFCGRAGKKFLRSTNEARIYNFIQDLTS